MIACGINTRRTYLIEEFITQKEAELKGLENASRFSYLVQESLFYVPVSLLHSGNI